MANHPQALKRARQSEKRRQRNMAVKSRIRTRVRALRYSVDQLEQLKAGRHIHPQEVEKHLLWLTEGKATDLKAGGGKNLVKDATGLLAKYDSTKHADFLLALAHHDLSESERLLSKAASKGVFQKKTAARRISRLKKMVNALDA